jgi:hypothetical protein
LKGPQELRKYEEEKEEKAVDEEKKAIVRNFVNIN